MNRVNYRDFLFPVVLIVLIGVLLLWFKPWDENGMLNFPKYYSTEAGSSNTKVGKEVFYGYMAMRAQKEPITILSIQPLHLAQNVRFKSYGIQAGKDEIGVGDIDDYRSTKKKHNLHPLPYTVSSTTKYIVPLISLSASKPGIYKVRGLVVTYKYKNSFFREIYKTQFVLHCQTSNKQ